MGHVEVAGFLLANGSSILERDDVGDHQLLALLINELCHAVGYGNNTVQNPPIDLFVAVV